MVFAGRNWNNGETVGEYYNDAFLWHQSLGGAQAQIMSSLPPLTAFFGSLSNNMTTGCVAAEGESVAFVFMNA
jgi:hypothetical protein